MQLHKIGKMLNLNKYSFLKSCRITVYEEKGGGVRPMHPSPPSKYIILKIFAALGKWRYKYWALSGRLYVIRNLYIAISYRRRCMVDFFWK